MFIKHLLLKDFRNYALLSLPLERGLTVLHGPNAHGKTNLLEAIYLLATAESPRAREGRELVRFGAPFAIVKGVAVEAERSETLEIRILGGRKEARVAGKPLPRLSDLVGRMAAVLFMADDLQMVKGPPELRREFMDLCLSQASIAYREALHSYRKALQGRNQLLKAIAEGSADESLLSYWDEQVAAHGSAILKMRLKMLEEMEGFVEECSQALESGRIRIRYRPTVPVAEDLRTSFLSALREGREEDLEKGATQIGPHRDDLEITLDERDARLYCSQGEQRLIALALRYAEFRWLAERKGFSPVLLLDDVMSELDRRRRERVAQLASSAEQVLLTCTELDALPPSALSTARKARVFGGRVEYE